MHLEFIVDGYLVKIDGANEEILNELAAILKEQYPERQINVVEDVEDATLDETHKMNEWSHW